ncbi:SDR family oxidoreductase [Actinocatenispora rupis]|uniref:NAD(P)-dependent oxidoreductase n=1 Tax=Actinocatenispora rupis TaxID=519421 RepID=A0A8J3IZ66_9ACTN|nr:SDR family oxidoreductase [Actinocatenispora rupis]GID12731.1 NAD(P)-dependent oxidoreductase [Actinocatenispora rupis]
MADRVPRCAVFGATGYIGGRLVPDLLAAGYRVRVVARDPARLAGRPWHDDVEICRGDALDADSVRAALDDVDVAYYLVHSLRRQDFADLDRRAARILADAADAAAVGRIVYLGGLHPADQQLSAHLRSRREVGDILLAGPVPTVVLQAAVIIGSGSASFEMLRYLTERLPAMVTPRWVDNRIQPIAIRDVLRYLVAAASLSPGVHRAFDIGGPDVLTYREMMRRYAAVAGLSRRVVVPVPVLTPWLSAQWVNLVTPVPRSIAVPLIESLVNEVVCGEHDIAEFVPPPPEGLLHFEDAVALALTRVRESRVSTRWSDAAWPRDPSQPSAADPEWSGGTLYQDVRTRYSSAGPDRVWQIVEGIGGEHGWYSFPLAWAVRGWADRVAGGVGLRRGRRDPYHLHVGEALDWWRVEQLDRGSRLLLRAEMRVPGDAWLELTVTPADDGGTVYRQRALFRPQGLTGHLYWKSVAPFHTLVFGGMVANITGAAEQPERTPTDPFPAAAPAEAAAPAGGQAHPVPPAGGDGPAAGQRATGGSTTGNG